MTFILLLSIAVIVYSYVVYPFLLFIISAIYQTISDSYFLINKQQRRLQNQRELPSVAVIISAYNEQECIAQRIDNLLSMDYPADLLNIYIGSDGSVDNTNSILEPVDHPQVHIHLFQENRGKTNVLNDLVDKSCSDIIVFSDANSHFATDVIQQLVSPFGCEKIGAVCGELRLSDIQDSDNKDGIYWRYEQMLKFHESRINALLGANGAIYAIRRSLYVPPAGNTITDDFQIAVNVSKQGARVFYQPQACAFEPTANNANDEKHRRIRIGMGNYQALKRNLWLLNPFRGWRCFSYISHKVCRWLTPHFMCLAFFSNLFLLDQFPFQVIFSLQVVFYFMAFLGRDREKSNTLFSFVSFFVLMNWALLLGFVQFCKGKATGSWQRTER